MIVYEVLKADHDKVKDLLEQIEKTTERGVKIREELWGKVNAEVALHKQLEEDLFYPRLEKFEETRAIILEAYEEHGLVEGLMEQLNELEVSDEVWTAKFKVFKENLTHHANEEERELFPAARKVLSREEATGIGEAMEAAKKAAKGMEAQA